MRVHESSRHVVGCLQVREAIAQHVGETRWLLALAVRAISTGVFCFLGEEVQDRYRVEERDCYEGIDETDLDRIVLDLPEPWQVVKHAERALHPGGILLAYTPSIVQVVQLREALAASAFDMPETLEVLNRTWHVEGQAVRPDHRMVAHTGFLTHARLLGG